MKYEKHCSLIDYVNGFTEFEQYIKDINRKQSNVHKHHGYLINLTLFEELKKRINNDYIQYKKHLSESISYNIKEKFTIGEIEFRNSNYLLNMIFNGNKYILINTKLWDLICKEDNKNIPSIEYEINYLNIKFSLEDKKELIFFNKNDNIIDSFFETENPEYSIYKKNYNYIVNNIYKNISEYYHFQKDFIRKLGYKYSSYSDSGYLVDIDWFNKWEKLCYYSHIKSNYLDKDKSCKEIIDFLIFVNQTKKFNLEQLPKPNKYKFETKEQLCDFLKNKSKLVLINESLVYYSLYYALEPIYYELCANKIKFKFNYQKTFELEVKDNIISLQSNNNVVNQNLDQLLKIFYLITTSFL